MITYGFMIYYLHTFYTYWNKYVIIIHDICRATMQPPRPSSTAECLHLIACLREEQASMASWEPRPPFEAAKMD